MKQDDSIIPVLIDWPLSMWGRIPRVGDVYAIQAYEVEPSAVGISVKLRPVLLRPWWHRLVRVAP